MTSGRHFTPTTVALAVLLAVQAVFQAALALGAPWGSAAWGGAHEGALPAGLRVTSAIAAVGWAWVVAVILHRWLGTLGRQRLLLVLAVYSSLGLLLNAASRSLPERLLWSPYALLVTVLAWWEWRTGHHSAITTAANR
jgi:hypothetical protein